MFKNQKDSKSKKRKRIDNPETGFDWDQQKKNEEVLMKSSKMNGPTLWLQ